MVSAIAGPLHIHAIPNGEMKNRVETLINLVKILKKMDLKHFKRTVRSIHLYQLAFLTYPIDVGLAYSLLVSSVDNLSCKLYDSQSSTWKFVKFIEQFLPESFWTSFDSRAWEEDRWLDSITPWKHSIVDSYKERFEKEGEKALSSLEGILNENAIGRLKTVFEKNVELPSQEKQVYNHILNHWYLYRVDMKLPQKELRDVLERIYTEVRSAFFHGGRSPPQSAVDRYETAPIKPKIREDGVVMWERDVPSFYAFERMVHDSILSYLYTQF